MGAHYTLVVACNMHSTFLSIYGKINEITTVSPGVSLYTYTRNTQHTRSIKNISLQYIIGYSHNGKW